MTDQIIRARDNTGTAQDLAELISPLSKWGLRTYAFIPDDANREVGRVSVLNFPSTQAVSGSVSVSNFPSSFQVSNFPATQTVAGTISVSNFPSTYAVTGTFWQSVQPISGTVAVNNFPSTYDVLDRSARLLGHVNVDNFPSSFQVSNFPSTYDISDRSARLVGHVTVDNQPSDPATQTTLASVLSQLQAVLKTSDKYLGGEVLADQTGADGVLTFTFTNPVDLIWIRADGSVVRADPFGGTPSASLGIYCDDGIPNPITITATTVKVYAPTATTVKVWGFKY